MIRIINEFFLRHQVCENDEQLQTISLRFKNNDIEESYQKKNMSKLFLQFRVYSLLQIIINFVYILSSGFVYKNWNNAQLRSGFIGWILSTLLIQAKLKTKIVVITNIIIYINSVIHILLYSYFTDNITKQQGNIDIIVSLAMMSGLNQALFVMTFSFIQSSYLYQTLTLSTCFLTLMGIYDSFGNYKLWTQYLLLIFTCYLLRSNEKNNRLAFFLIRKNHQNLKACKKIYDETVPAQIIILEYSNNEILNSIDSQNIFTENRYADILYFNKSASIHFGSIEKEQVLFRLNQIEIVSDQKISEKLMDKIVETHSIMDTEQRYSRSNTLDYQIANISKEYQCKRQIKSQDIQYYDVKALGCIWEGKRSVMLIMNETTDRVKNIQQLQELDQYKDNLLASVSHDLKTPLNGLLMTINIMKSIIDHKYELGQIEIKGTYFSLIKIKEISRYIDDIISTQNILLSMINDLNDFSQLRKLGLRLNFTQFSLETCINQIKQIFGGLMDKKRLEFKIEGNYQKIEMYNDETRLKQILINLISNAIKFTYKGSITLIVQQIITEDRLRLIKFVIKDTGIGIPEHIQHKLFKAYSSFNTGNCNNYGVGLGLVISKQMVGLLGPKEFINLNSYESAGSTFSFEVYQNAHFKEETQIPNLDSSPIYRPPYFQPKSMTQMRSASLLEIQIATRDSFRIVIVDDDAFSSYALKQIVQNMFTVADIDEALNGQLALEKIFKRKYDIIFMDLDMPVMDGRETIIEIRKYEKANHLPRSLIIISSGYKEIDKSIDCDEYLEKPMKIQKLRKILNDRKLL